MYLYYLVPENLCKQLVDVPPGPLISASLEKQSVVFQLPPNSERTSTGRIFERLVPYLNGQYTVEEIIYREKLSRYYLVLNQGRSLNLY
jgi:hypothetical protein